MPNKVVCASMHMSEGTGAAGQKEIAWHTVTEYDRQLCSFNYISCTLFITCAIQRAGILAMYYLTFRQPAANGTQDIPRGSMNCLVEGRNSGERRKMCRQTRHGRAGPDLDRS
jgi:hypothetical protein